MCGIAGFFEPGGFDAAISHPELAAMSAAIAHRGPDDSGFWTDASAGIALAHQRLAVIDLSGAGAQPMNSSSGRWTITYNGEIYNFQELRHQLEERGANAIWNGHSDTEVLLAAIEYWGVEKTLPRLDGMFAFAAWDRKEQTLWLVRDRFGEKPLYYGWSDDVFFFASELKAVTAHSRFRPEIDDDALSAYVRYGFVPHPLSIYRGLSKLPPGTLLELSRRNRAGNTPAPQLYWDIDRVIGEARSSRFDGDLDAAADELDRILGRAVEERMVSDVALGGLLSGGLDSSLIVALMQARSSAPVRTYTIGSPEPGYNEAEIASQIARHLGTDHTEFYVEPADALSVIPELGRMYDEPFADSSQIPTHMVARLVRQTGTVALSGDCGDELFGGYNRYIYGPAIGDRIARLPEAIRKSASALMTFVPPAMINRITGRLGKAIPAELNGGAAGEKIHKLAASLAAPGQAEFWELLLSSWPDPRSVLAEGHAVRNLTDIHRPPAELHDLAEKMMYRDTRCYMSDDVLAKVDRASMAASLEVRVPFLDPAVFAFAWSLPSNLKIGNGAGKLVLRRLLSRYLPAQLLDRPKQGFAVPIGRWLRKELRDWAEAYLSVDRLTAGGHFNVEVVRKCWQDHLSGRRNFDTQIWTILMFQAWLDEFAAQAKPLRQQQAGNRLCAAIQ